MSEHINVLHSHSLLERDLGFPKRNVLIDPEYIDRFEGCDYIPQKTHCGTYYSVNILDFVKRGGVFKPFKQ